MNEHKFGNEYPGLAIISGICKVIGFVIVVIAVIGLFYGFSLLGGYDSDVMGIVLIFSSILCGIVFSVPFFAFGELIKVFVRIEFNTRKGNIGKDVEVVEEESQTASNNKCEWQGKFPVNSHVVELKTEKQYRIIEVDNENNLYICSSSGMSTTRVSFAENEIELFSIWVENLKKRK